MIKLYSDSYYFTPTYFGKQTSAGKPAEGLDVHGEYVVLVPVVLLEPVDAVLKRIKIGLLGVGALKVEFTSESDVEQGLKEVLRADF